MFAKGTLTNSYQVELNIDDFDYTIDRSTALGGENTGTSPHGFLLGSIASCKAMVAKGYLDHNNIAYNRVEVEAESGILGKKRNETIEITVNLQVFGAHLDEKQIGFMTRIVDNGCTMANILTAGGQNKVNTIITTV